ncbi:MAG: NAD(P)-dependent oxidoreductase [Deltaproteobacteria bacterium]|nr:NAD(P)-dependent oxidoreductase [Deltaproteobacteria bacterium]
MEAHLKTVTLTGATGFIGSHLARALIDRGVALHLWVRRSTPLIRALKQRGAAVHIDTGRETGPGLRRALEKADAVIHCAAATKALNRRSFFDSNVTLTERILSRLDRHQTFLLISSQAAAGPSPGGIPVDETVRPAPVNGYGWSKRLAEWKTRAWAHDNDLNCLILRPSAVYGPGEKDFYRLFKSIQNGVALLPGNGRQRLSLLHVDDLVQAILAAMERGRRGETYFVTGEETASWLELASLIQAALSKDRVLTLRGAVPLALPAAFFSEALSRLTGKPGLLCRDKVAEMRQEAWLCSNRKIKEHLVWRPRVSLREGVEQTAAWYVREGWI